MNLTQSKKTTLALAAAALFGAGAVGGWAVAAHPVETSAATVSEAPIPLGIAPNYRAIVKQNRDAVVGITTDGKSKVKAQEFRFGPGSSFGDSPFGSDPFFQFFRQLPVPPDNFVIRGQGSGFIVGSDGIVLTNAHVVRDADHVTVKLADRREFKAKVLGVDPATDIAVLKIDAHGLPTVRLGDSDRLVVGDYVLAIGAPFGLEESATAGIVSAKGRSLPGDSSVPFIQTDVAVNPGNSGGPLFDANGAVVGVNSQIYTNSGGYQGVSFAIPIDIALRVKDQIMAHGKVEHARLGVVVQALTEPLAKSFGLDTPSGALVSKV
ncbi:MAG TPA: trypsin-like peptidase domain-containing protein, partial [Rudaea sp.]|nr:trypsin-like peptidase domain-containing protein [Rudaea sp.]